MNAGRTGPASGQAGSGRGAAHSQIGRLHGRILEQLPGWPFTGDPAVLQEVAADFPDLQIVMAHPGVPWQDEQLSVALHKPNVWIDLSGWSPKYFEPKLVQYVNTLLKDRVLFGSDNPVILPDRWIADFEKAAIKPEVRPLVMKENAVRLLKLRTPTAPA